MDQRQTNISEKDEDHTSDYNSAITSVTDKEEKSSSPLQPNSPSVSPNSPSKPLKTMGERILKNLEFAADGGTLCSDFVKGTLSEQYHETPSDELQLQYFQQCLRSLEWSFTDNLIKGPTMLSVYASAIEEMNGFIKHAMALGLTEQEIMREKLPLDSAPFKYAKKLHLNIQELHKDDEIRIAFQALFLFILRLYIPIKYEDLDVFLERYPELKERTAAEQERLRNTANWMDLAFYTIQPRNNKTFILNLIPRIVEGKTARYITGSGQTKPTSDRVNLFRNEGNCEKIKRPPRRKKEEILMANAAKLRSESRNAGGEVALNSNTGMDANQLHALQKFYENPHLGPVPFPPFLLPYYPPGMIPPKDLQRFKAWQQAGGGLPTDSRRIATYQDQIVPESYDLSQNGTDRNLPWFPPNNAAPHGMNNFYTDYMSNRRGGSNVAQTAFFHPYEYERFRLNPQYNPQMPSSSSASASAFQYPTNFNENNPHNNASGFLNYYANFTNQPSFNQLQPYSSLPPANHTSTAPPPPPTPPAPPSIYYNSSFDNNGDRAILDAQSEGQSKRQKSSNSPTSNDVASSMLKSLPVQQHVQYLEEEEHHLKSSTSTSTSEGGLDVLLAVAGSMDGTPKDEIK